MFMVLEREDAVLQWRDLMGKTDPTDAKQENPNRFSYFISVEISKIYSLDSFWNCGHQKFIAIIL